ncbi:MAG: phospho-N-acetylmuramoyl-pentapeptide-transferase [Thermotogae bacterium]|nr:phospho-N-acetylmuramoyl-pentapeptide-transferase [Thermotogota bacterium]
MTSIVAIILYKPLIKFFKKVEFGQYIREEGPDLHNYKTGTPTAGGILFLLLPLIFAIFSHAGYLEWICVFSLLIFGGIGLADDLISILRKNATGLRTWQKISLQVVGSVVLLHMLKSYTRQFVPIYGGEFDLGRWGYVLAITALVGASNAVNLTDGVDGLAGWNFLVSMGGLVVFSAIHSRPIPSTVLILMATVLGFLWYNSHPAKLFMGDTGSLALGGVLATYAIINGGLLYLPIFGLVFVVETLSVIIQVLSFKIRKKRVFLMSPLHHHFELLQWPEEKIVARFVIVSLVASMVALSM